MGKENYVWEMIEESNVNKPESIIEISCPFGDEYFAAYRNAEKKIIRNTEAYAEAYFSAANICLH